MKTIKKHIFFPLIFFSTSNVYALDYCKMYGEHDPLCLSQRMQQNTTQYPSNMREAQAAIDRVGKLIEACNDGKGNASACYTLCNEGVHYDICSNR